MGRYSGGSDRPFWLEAWNGGRHVVERVGRSIVVEHLLVGVVGSFQPDKLARAFAGDEDGMYGRFLYAWPLAPEYRPLTNEAAEIEPELQSALTALIRLPSEDVGGIFSPQLSGYRKMRSRSSKNFVCGLIRRSAGSMAVSAIGSCKGETVVLRLAGTLAYLAWSIALGTPSANGLDGITGSLEPKTIDKKFMSDAIRLWRDFFWPHARAATAANWLKRSAQECPAGSAMAQGKRRPKKLASSISAATLLAQSLDARANRGIARWTCDAGWLRRQTSRADRRPPSRSVVGKSYSV